MTTPAKKDQLLDQALESLLGRHVAPEVLLAELNDILATKPTMMEMGTDDGVLPWIGRVKAALHSWDSVQATQLMLIEPKLYSNATQEYERAYRELLALIHQARSALR